MVLAILLAARPVAGRGTQTAADDSSVLPGEWFVTGATTDPFGAAVAVVQGLGVRVERADAAQGVIVTREADYGAAWPSVTALGLPPTHVPKAAAIHVRVAPGWSPPRLAVGAVLTASTITTPLAGKRARGESILYGQRSLASAIAERIARQAGATLVPIPAQPAERARTAARLGDRAAARCGEPPVVPNDDKAHMPVVVSQVSPVYPRAELVHGRAGMVLVRGEMTEHGTLTHLEWLKGVEDDNLLAATFGAAGLWRFVAPVMDECATRRTITIEMTFSIRSR
ncbi:MAG: energy transducer TonB [Vicinamibacterales bacterium]